MTITKSLLNKTQTGFLRGYLKYQKFLKNSSLKFFPNRYHLVPGTPPKYFLKLRTEIDRLKNIIDRDYCVLDLPAYNNIGDHIIYEGTLDFLDTLPYQNRYEASCHSFQENKINKDLLIILQGGGNFGDLWPSHQKFREYIISSFPKNKIIILPQTIFFQDKRKFEKSISNFSIHPNLTICTRDKRSYEMAKNNFSKNTVMLLPDMASYKQIGLIRRESPQIKRVLYMKRQDKELKADTTLSFIKNMEVHDWPTFEYNYYKHLTTKHKNNRFYLNEGMTFIAQYDLVISTRLHGCILSILLGIPTILVDNSYGKNRTYYQTWLTDHPNCFYAANKVEIKRIIKINYPEVIT